jgi:hypothetical protein
MVSDADTLTASGIWGYCAFNAVPELARAAVLAHASLGIAAPSVQAGGATRVLSQAEEGDVKYQWGSSIQERQAAVKAWQSDWQAAMAYYRRVKVF